jgi:hypothetical protein
MTMKNSRIVSFVALVLVTLLGAPRAHAQAAVPGPDIWRTFAERIEPGKTLKIRLTTGERFKATLLQVSDQGMTVQPKTRTPVPPQIVPFAQVASVEIDTGKGANVGKAIAIGASVAAATFFAFMMTAIAVWSD